MYVPTRQEVGTSPAALFPVLADWLWESPTEPIPSNAGCRGVLGTAGMVRRRECERDASDRALDDYLTT